MNIEMPYCEYTIIDHQFSRSMVLTMTISYTMFPFLSLNKKIRTIYFVSLDIVQRASATTSMQRRPYIHISVFTFNMLGTIVSPKRVRQDIRDWIKCNTAQQPYGLELTRTEHWIWIERSSDVKLAMFAIPLTWTLLDSTTNICFWWWQHQVELYVHNWVSIWDRRSELTLNMSCWNFMAPS